MIAECLVVEVAVAGDDCPLADATGTTGTAVEARPPLLRRDGNALLAFAAPDEEALVDRLDADDRLRYLHVGRVEEGRRTVRCLSKRPCVVHDLVDAGFLVSRLRYRGDETTFTGAVVGTEVLRGVIERARETVGVTLERVRPLTAEADVDPETPGVPRRHDLTRKQREAIRTAVELGYFAVPREATAREVAAELGISKSAFLERLRRGQATVLERV